MTKVLLVEDDNNLREIYEARLAAEGYDIVTAKDGEEALEVAKQHRPELIISDVMMPRISGFEMLDILRTTNGLKDAKVIMLTALGQAEDKARADHLGADRYLVKSQVTLEDIVNAADELLNGVEAPVSPAEITPAAFAPEQTAAPAPAAPATPAVEHTDAQPVVATATPVQAPAPAPVEAQPVAALEPAVPQEPQTAALPQTGNIPSPLAPETVIPAPAVVQEPVMEAPAAPEPVAAPVQQPAPVLESPLPMPTIPSTDTPQPVVAQPVPAPAFDATPQPSPVVDPAPLAPTAPVQVDQPVTAMPQADPAQQAPQAATAPPQPDVTQPSDPLTSEIPVIELPDLDVQPEAPEETDEANPVKVQMPANPDTDIVNTAQTSSDEEAAIEEQIEQFIHTESVMPQGVGPQPQTEIEPVESSPADESSNASLINSAVEQLANNQDTPDANVPPTETQPEPAVAGAEASEPLSANQIPGKKVIQPMSVPEDTKDLATLVAQEEMEANAAKGLTGPAVVADTTAPVAAPPLAITPDAPSPGGVFTPNADGNAQSNAL